MAITLAFFPDGTSTTALVSEQLIAWQVPRRIEPRRNGVWLPSGPAVSLDALVNECRAQDPRQVPVDQGDIFRGLTWLDGSSNFSQYNDANSPNGNSCWKSGTLFSVMSANSDHPGGVKVLFVDGHVQFIKDSVDLGVWRGLATRAGGEVISAQSL